MESPTSWTKVTYLINKTLAEANADIKAGVIGLSIPKQIENALKDAGFLTPESQEK